ncbi:MAG: PAS domain-containing protein [Rhodanobacteraceae bacterium]|nr:PAS domain-containing protein [Rhodanobacteraceae bacterium]
MLRGLLTGLMLLLASGIVRAGANAAAATVDSVRFRNFGIASGLSQVTARALLQDEQGFVWIGTQDGLNRFDGFSFRTYHRDRQDPHALGDSHITALARGEHGALWVGTMAGGLSRLDPATEDIQAWRHRPDQPSSLAADGVSALLRARDGQLWVATSGGALQRLAPAASGFQSLGPPPAELGVIRSMVEDADGQVWLAGSRGLWRYRPQDGGFATIGAGVPALADLQALALAADGSLWVGATRLGLLRLAADGQVLAHYRAQPGVDGALPDDQVRALLATRAGQLWVGTMNGLAIHQPEHDDFLSWRHDAGDAGSPAANRIAALHEDRDGLIWIGTWTGGFSIHNPATQVVRLIRAHGRDRTSLPASPVRALWLDHDGSLWMGVLEGGGLIHYDLEQGVLQRWVHDADDPASLAGNVVQSIARTPDGRLWVGTQGTGLSRMRADGKGFDHFRRDDGTLPDNVVQVLHVDRAGSLWVGFETGGLARWIDDAHGFQVHAPDPDDPHSLQSGSVYSMAETASGEFWIGTFGAGLARFDRASGRFEHFRERPGDLESISHNSVTMIIEAHDGTLWVGTQGGGLNRVSRREDGTLRFDAIGKREGLGADAIGTLIEDTRGRLWIGTTVGVNAYDPATREVQRFSASDGMDRSGYFIGSVARGADGSIYLGGLRGVLGFHPDRLPRRGRVPQVVFSDLRLDNAEVRLKRFDPGSPLARAIHSVDQLVLGPEHSSIAIDLSALDYANPDSLRFSYRLDGLDEEWIEVAQPTRTAAYNNLTPGSYRLRARVRGDDGGGYGPESSLALVIQPQPWRAPGALTLYAMLIGLLGLALVVRTRRRWERERAAADSIRRSEERLKLALWGSRDELWDLDLRSGKMVRENILPIISTSATVHFASREEFLREVHPDDQPDVLSQLTRHIQGQSEFYENTYRMRTLDGLWCWVLSRGFAVERDASGRALRMVGTSRDVSASAEAAEQLRKLNDELEHRVEERTRALKLSNRELQFTLDELKLTQRQLVESEKMAALGGLVAGIAHEINTPLGIGVTAASHLEDETRKLMKLVGEGKVSRGALDAYQSEALSSAQLILSNLRRAGQLIKSFKQVAVDQSSEQAREIDLRTYLEEVLVSLGPALKKTPHTVSIKCPENLRICTYPGAISQIVVNLVMNSLIHAFEGIEHGEIRIECESYDEEWLLLYRDNGIGMTEDVRLRVFDPFFTTKRGQGGSGLGLHVVYNLVTQLLRGSLDCISAPGKGVEFQIQMPKRVG